MTAEVPNTEASTRTSPRPRFEDFELTIDSLDTKGHGRSRVQLGKRKEREIRVRGVLPGERVRACVIRKKKKLLIGRALELLDASPARIEPRCRHALRPGMAAAEGCGGCALQMLPYEEQLALKERAVREHITRAGIDPELVRPIIGAPGGPWFYRNKMELSFGCQPGGGLALGLHPPERRFDVFPMRECFLQSDEVAALGAFVRDWAARLGLRTMARIGDGGWLRTFTIREGKRTGQRLCELTTTEVDPVETSNGPRPAQEIAESFRDASLLFCEERGIELSSLYWTQHRAVKGERTRLIECLLHGSETYLEELRIEGQRPLRFEVHPRAFFQPNPLGAEVLYGQVARAAGLDEPSGGPPTSHVLDLYCGTGTIGLCLAERAGRVTGVEMEPDAVEGARRSAVFNGIENATFHAGDVAKVLAERLQAGEGAADLVVVDPPRGGLTVAACQRVMAAGASRVVYVSCNPVSLARDLGFFGEEGWRPIWIQPVDMFPHTAHVENVVRVDKV